MPDAKPDADRELDEAASLGADDVDALLAQAKAYRAQREMQKCFDAYRAAAELGSGEAEYAVALFHLNGGVVAQDLKEGATRLRLAAERGSVPAKVYLGNLYELGIYYKADPEKADVWYRNAARAARIEAEPGTDEHARALAELGCARYVLALVETGEVDADDKARLLARAKAHGYGLRVKETGIAVDPTGDRATFVAALADAEADAAASGGSGGSSESAAARQRADTTPATKAARTKALASRGAEAEAKAAPKRARQEPSRAAAGLAAFGYALLFAAAGLGAAYAATLGAHELVERGHRLPAVGTRVELVFPIVLAAVGVLPAWLVYRFSAFAKAVAGGAAFAGIGWVAWGAGQTIHASRGVQAIAFALAGFLASLLVLGLLGGTKAAATKIRR